MENVVIIFNRRSSYLKNMSDRLESMGIESHEINRIINLLEYVEKLIGRQTQA